MARTLKVALEMPADERADRLAALKPRVAALDVHRWAGRFLRSLAGKPDRGAHATPPAGTMPGTLVSYPG